MVPGFSLRQLSYLSAVAQYGSIAAAAEVEHVSQAAISTGLQDLERRLGLQLLTRRPGHGASLTEAGSMILGDARRVIQASNELMSSAKAPNAELRGTLRLGCFTTLSPIFLPQLMSTFAGDHPALELDVLEGSQDELLRALHDGTCELAITYGAGIGDGVATKQLRRMAPYVLLASHHPLADRESIDLGELADTPHIEYTNEPGRTEDFLRSKGYSPRTLHRSANIEVVRGLIARGLGWSIMFQRWPRNVSLDGLPLAAVPVSGDVPSLDVVAAWREQDQLSRRSRAAISFLLSEVGDASSRASDHGVTL
jgi:DNA-binding transcriptional LysR family regulator